MAIVAGTDRRPDSWACSSRRPPPRSCCWLVGYTLLFLGRVAGCQRPRAKCTSRDGPTGICRRSSSGWAGGSGPGWSAASSGGFRRRVLGLLWRRRPLQRLILVELLASGRSTRLMALLASILHEDVRAANPITVVAAIWRSGWGYLRPCLLAGVAVVVTVTLLGGGVSRWTNPCSAGVLSGRSGSWHSMGRWSSSASSVSFTTSTPGDWAGFATERGGASEECGVSRGTKRPADRVGPPGHPTAGVVESCGRRRHPRVAPGLGECLVYPLLDGPGVACWSSCRRSCSSCRCRSST